MNELQYEQAKELGEKALEAEPENMKVLDLLSGLLLEIGDAANAFELLQKMVHLEPDQGFRKYLSLGQLTGGKESLAYYDKGVQILCNLLQAQQTPAAAAVAAAAEEQSETSLKRALSSAYSAMAEIYMTDCCDEEEAEAQCADLVQKSVQADPTNPEAYQVQASYLLVKQEHEVLFSCRQLLCVTEAAQECPAVAEI